MTETVSKKGTRHLLALLVSLVLALGLAPGLASAAEGDVSLNDGTYQLSGLKAAPSDMFNHMEKDSRVLKVAGDTATISFTQDGSSASVGKYSRIALGNSDELVKTAYQPDSDLPAGTTIIDGTEAGEGDKGTKWHFDIPLPKADVEKMLSTGEKLYVAVWNNQGSSADHIPGWFKASNPIYLDLGELGAYTADLSDGTYDIDLTSNFGMFGLKAPAVDPYVVVKGDDAWLVATTGNTPRYGELYNGLATEVSDETSGIEGITVKNADGDVAGYTFVIPMTKAELTAAITNNTPINYVVRYLPNYSDTHDHDWYIPKEQSVFNMANPVFRNASTDLPTPDAKIIELKPINEELMWVVVKATIEDNAEGQDFLNLYFNSDAYGYVFAGTQAEAVASYDKRDSDERWSAVAKETISSTYVTYQDEEKTVESTEKAAYRIPITLPDQTSFTIPVVAYATDNTARRVDIDLEAGTATFGNYKGTAAVSASSTVEDVKVDKAGSWDYQGYVRPYAGAEALNEKTPLSNEWISTLTFKLTDAIYDKVYAVTDPEAEKAEEGAVAVAEDGTVALPVVNTYRPKAAQYDGKTVTVKMHVSEDAPYVQAGTWVERTFALELGSDLESATLEISGDPLTEPVWTRLGGANRNETMQRIVQAGFETSEYAVIATSGTFPDALAASALAGAYDAPIILTPTANLGDATKAELERLGVKKAFIVGGTAAVSEAAEAAIKALNIEVVRVSGANRYETSLAVFDQLIKDGKTFDTVIVATGKTFPDALSASPYAYAKVVPIVLARATSGLSADAIKAIQSVATVKNVVIVGGTGVVPEATETQLGDSYKPERFAGGNRYETSAEIAKWALSQGLTAAYPGLATGVNWPDALVGGALCGKNNSVLVLAKDEKAEGIPVLAAVKDQLICGYDLGGTGVIADELAKYVAEQTAATYEQPAAADAGQEAAN